MGKKKTAAAVKRSKVISLKMDAAFFFERAVQSLDRFHYEKALKYFRRAVDYEPDNPVNHCNMAGILSEMGQYSDSNAILRQIVEDIDPSMTECYFYMANNYANMDDFESAETALVYYLEHDPDGQFLEESEEMLDLISYELGRTPQLTTIKSREGLFDHDQARAMLEEGKFSEAVRLLEKLIKKHPEFLAARNNLALAYYYLGLFEKSFAAIREVLDIDSGNLHALCNQAIFYQHFGEQAQLAPLAEQLVKTVPFHSEHVFKLATTMGILGRHEEALRHFSRLIKDGSVVQDPCLYHYAAVAACNLGKYDEAGRLWQQAAKLDPGSDIPRFYLSELAMMRKGQSTSPLHYHYHLPYEEQFRALERSPDATADQIKRDPLIRSSFFWALRHGDYDTKLQVIQTFGMIGDSEVEDALRRFICVPEEDDYLKKVAVFVLRSIGVTEPLKAVIGGQTLTIDKSSLMTPNLPIWEDRWQNVMEIALQMMHKRYDMIQQHDLQTLWVEFLARAYPDVPKITKAEGWAAALEYLTAKMHRRAITYHEVAVRYGVSITTISKNVKIIDEVCKLKEKMQAIFPQFTGKFE